MAWAAVLRPSGEGPSLDGCFAKLQRAEDHIGMLRADIQRNTPLIPLTQEHDFDPPSQHMKVSAKVEDVPPLPIRWSVLMGDVVQNIRSGLDYLVYELIALEAGGTYWEDSQFPIALTPAGHAGRRAAETIARLGRHWSVVEASQPYGGHDPPHLVDFAFWYLKEFSNQDKHRLLVPASATIDLHSAGSILMASSSLRPLGKGYLNAGVLEPGAVLASEEYLVVGPQPEVYLAPTYMPMICFREEPSIAVYELLDVIHQKATRLVASFQALFH